MKKIKVSDVWDARAKFKAVAECETESCQWAAVWPQNDRDVRNQAKKHLVNNPTHSVLVTVSDVTKYYVPKRILETLEEE